MKFKILIVRNRLLYPIDKSVALFCDWVRQKTPLEPVVEYIDSDIVPSYASFGKFPQGELYGLEGIKEKIRLLVPVGTYHSVFFVYAFEGQPPGEVANFTYPNPLHDNEPFSEIFCVFKEEALQRDELVRTMTHEFCHQLHRRVWFGGGSSRDDMDLYDKESDIYAPDGNRARNLLALGNQWDIIVRDSWKSKLLYLLSLAAKVLGLQSKLAEQYFLPPATYRPPSVQMLADAIEAHEGVRKELNNPGGLRSSPYQSGSITQSTTGKPLAIFPSYADGKKALIHQLTIVRDGTSPAYTAEAKKLGLSSCADLSVAQMIGIYAPASENNTKLYYESVCQRLLIPTTFRMGDFT